MKSLSRDVRRPRDCKRKRENDDNPEKEKVRLEKQLKSSDFPQNNVNLNVDESAGFFDEYCQILLKDNCANDPESSVTIDNSMLSPKDHEIFTEISRISLSVKLKNWALKNIDTMKISVIDELLMILRDEGYLDLPSTGSALIQDIKTHQLGKNKENTEIDDFEKVDIWIKKEESCESLWNNDDNNSSEPLSHDEIEQKMSNDVICPDFAVTEFINDDNGKNKKIHSEKFVNSLQNAKFYGVLKDELQKMEQRWARQLESTKRSLLYDMVRKYEDLKNRIGLSSRPLGTSFTDDREILGVKLPFVEVDAFCEFDESIGDNPEKEIATKSLMTTLCFGAASLSNSIGCILSAFLTKDVQMQYSACGKKIKGIKKRNFGDTNTFRYAKDVLREKHGTSDAEIVSKTSRWFTGAGDRDGGRKERRK